MVILFFGILKNIVPAMPRIELICITLREDLIEIQKSYGYSGTQSGAGKLGDFPPVGF
jgi:hypothetical protein